MIACCGKPHQCFKRVNVRRLRLLTKELDIASTFLQNEFAGIQINRPKLAQRRSKIPCGQPNKTPKVVFGSYHAILGPSALHLESQKRGASNQSCPKLVVLWCPFWLYVVSPAHCVGKICSSSDDLGLLIAVPTHVSAQICSSSDVCSFLFSGKV
jgi:hypothetical protein